MFLQRFFSYFMAISTPRSRGQLLTKPLFALTLFLIDFVLAEALIIGHTPPGLDQRLLIATVASVPFLITGFAVLMYFDWAQQDMTDLALTDVLTDLPNRRAFVMATEHQISKGQIGFLLIIDADHFKRVNDTYGHAVGDLCLKAIAERLRRVCGPHDIVGRIGGEEFGAFFPHRSIAELGKIGKHLCSTLSVAVPELDAPLSLTVSIGATEKNELEDLNTALQRADVALYAAKENGRAQMHMWRLSAPVRAA